MLKLNYAVSFLHTISTYERKTFMAKKIISLMLSVIMCLSMAIVAFAASYSLGDVNGDGKISASDARTVLRSAAKLQNLTEDESKAADIDSSGKVTASDARIILRISAKLDSIDNYIKDEPPAEDPPAEDPPAEDPPAEDPPVSSNDIAYYVGKDVSQIKAKIPGLEYESLDTLMAISEDECGLVCAVVDYKGKVIMVSFQGEWIYSILGLTAGMTTEEASDIFEAEGLVYIEGDDWSNAWEDEATGLYYIFYAEEDIVYGATVVHPDYVQPNNIEYLMSTEKSYILSEIPELKYSNSTTYVSYADNLTVMFDRSGAPSMISITGESKYRLFNITPGMSVEYALYIGPEIYDNGDNTYSVYDYELCLKCNIYTDGDVVTGVSVIKDVHSMEDYLGWSYDDIMEVFPYLVYYEGLYVCGSYVFAFNSSGYVCEAGIRYFTESDVYSCYYGQTYREAVDVLNSQGFVYYDTMDNGFIRYYNSSKRETLFIFKDAENFITFISIAK